MTSEDEAFYKDNCHGDYVGTCTKTVPRNWAKQQKRNEERDYAQQKKRSAEMEREYMEQELLSLEEIIPPKKSRSSPALNGYELDDDVPTDFPQIKILNGHRTMNESLMRCLVRNLADYKVTTNDLIGITVAIANTVFHQQWTIAKAQEETDEDLSSDNDDDTESDD
ncbi:hypothetical protein SNE40_001127 [Patella caerulea]|uniref:Uncharacterized protein n=1 Tax=Patella caerulea TaxID=87958 RepID=A0AAN8KFA3_PATCE